MNELTCIIIDDESKPAKLLKLLIEELDLNILVTDIFSNPNVALKALKTLHPDFIFLDIEMPEMNGFEFLKKMSNPEIPIVFVTGYANYAIDAIRIAAIDYLMKPIQPDELSEAIKKVRLRLKERNISSMDQILIDNVSNADALTHTIGIPSVEGIDFVLIKDIIYCEGTNRYTKVISTDRDMILSSYSLGKFSDLLSDRRFFQVHRSYLINLSMISQYKSEGTITLKDGSTIPIARRRKDEFLGLITKIG